MSMENEGPIQRIVELHAKPVRRTELMNLLASVVAKYGSVQPGFLGSLQYEVIDTPDILVETADWSSTEVRATAMQQAMTEHAYAPLEDRLAAPFRATVIRQLP